MDRIKCFLFAWRLSIKMQFCPSRVFFLKPKRETTTTIVICCNPAVKHDAPLQFLSSRAMEKPYLLKGYPPEPIMVSLPSGLMQTIFCLILFNHFLHPVKPIQNEQLC
jgi:hypothetical protein